MQPSPPCGNKEPPKKQVWNPVWSLLYFFYRQHNLYNTILVLLGSLRRRRTVRHKRQAQIQLEVSLYQTLLNWCAEEGDRRRQKLLISLVTPDRNLTQQLEGEKFNLGFQSVVLAYTETQDYGRILELPISRILVTIQKSFTSALR